MTNKNLKDSFLRLTQIVGQKAVSPEQAITNKERGVGPRKARPAIVPLIPVSSSTWLAGVKDGRFPKPVKLSERCTVWRMSDINALIEKAGAE